LGQAIGGIKGINSAALRSGAARDVAVGVVVSSIEGGIPPVLCILWFHQFKYHDRRVY